MILEFSVANYLSFKDKVTFNMEATGISDHPENTFSVKKKKLLRSAAIYGANSSGKSNLLHAMATMKDLIQDSAKMASTDQLDVTPFLLSTEIEKAPSFFEILCYIGGERYRYGFEVSREKVHTEWLFHAKVEAEKLLFVREGEAIELGNQFEEGNKLAPKTRANALFLSVVDQFNGPTAKKIMAWFDQFHIISGLEHTRYRGITFAMLEDAETKPALTNFLKALDLGFSGLQIRHGELDWEKIIEDLPEALARKMEKDFKGKQVIEFQTIHSVFGPDGELMSESFFDLDDQESAGTNKIFDLAGAVFSHLIEGGVLVVDELDAKLHPLLTKAIVGLFNSSEYNRRNAQLIFATHDTNLLYYGNFRRDQIYFTEKRQNGSTDLYALVEYKEKGETIRKDRSFEKDYIQGRYGAIPYLGNLGELFSKWQERQK